MSKYTKVYYGIHESEFVHVYWGLGAIVVFLIHGGFFKSKYGLNLMNPLAEKLAAKGYTVVNCEYPRVGQGYSAVEMLKSVFTAFDFLREIEPQALGYFAIGHSAGGYYALMLSERNQFSGTLMATENPLIPTRVIAQAPLTNLWAGQLAGLSDEGDAIKRFMESETINWCAPEYAYNFLSPSEYKEPACQRHIIHGTHDIEVPLRHSVQFLREQPKKTFLYRFEGNHYDVIDPNHEIWRLQTNLLITNNIF